MLSVLTICAYFLYESIMKLWNNILHGLWSSFVEIAISFSKTVCLSYKESMWYFNEVFALFSKRHEKNEAIFK